MSLLFTTIPTLFLPDAAERAANFNEDCPAVGVPFVRAGVVPVLTNMGMEVVSPNCPAYTNPGQDSNGDNYYLGFPNNTIPSNLLDPANTNPLMANVPFPNDGHAFVGTFAAPISWHEELIKVDDDINSKLRASFRFIHDSWTQNFPISPGTDQTTNVPAIGGTLQGPGISVVTNLTATISPTLLNEFGFSYGSNHLHLFNTGNAWRRPPA